MNGFGGGGFGGGFGAVDLETDLVAVSSNKLMTTPSRFTMNAKRLTKPLSVPSQRKGLRQRMIGLSMLCVVGQISVGCTSLKNYHLSSALTDSTQAAEPSVDLSPMPKLADAEFRIALETAKVAEQQGMDQEAIEQYLQARTLNPKVTGISHSLAVLFDRNGMVDARRRNTH